MTLGSPRASLYVKCVGTVRAASHPPVWIHRKCELRSLKKRLNGLCLDDDYTIAQWLEHRWVQAKVPGSSPGGDSQFFLQTFPVCLFPSKPVMTWGSPRASLYVKCVGTVRAASHPPVWIHRKCELRSLKKTLNGLCLDDNYTIAQWLEHRWLQAKVPGSSPGGDSQFFLQTFPVCLFPSKPVNNNNNNNNVEEKRTYVYELRVTLHHCNMILYTVRKCNN